MADDLSARLNVTGETRLYMVVGDPIAQVRSTQLYNRLVSEKGIDALFLPLQFSAENSRDVIRALRMFKNLDGIIPTIPPQGQFSSRRQ